MSIEQLERSANLLEFAAARLVENYGEHPNVDFVLGMKECAWHLRHAAGARRTVQALYPERAA
jgi:hypothetical protein